MITQGRWERAAQIIEQAMPMYRTDSLSLREQTLGSELRRFQDGVADRLLRHQECRTFPIYYAIYLSEWPWNADEFSGFEWLEGSNINGHGTWLLLKAVPSQPTVSQWDIKTNGATCGFAAALSLVTLWFPNFRAMPAEFIHMGSGGGTSPYLQVFHAIPLQSNATESLSTRPRVTHMVDTVNAQPERAGTAKRTMSAEAGCVSASSILNVSEQLMCRCVCAGVCLSFK